jgi:hypothetical protein
LLQCATPESVVRLYKSYLADEAEDLYEQYFEDQQHGCLKDLLEVEIVERRKKSSNEPVFMQVTTNQCIPRLHELRYFVAMSRDQEIPIPIDLDRDPEST